MQLKRVTGLLVAVLLVASMAAACSSSKKTDVSAGSGQKTTTTTAAKSSSGGGSGSGSNSGSNSGLGVLSSSDCEQAAVAFGKLLTSSEAAITGNKTDTSELNAEYDALGGKIPSSLQSQYKTVGDAYAKFAQDMKGASLTDMSALQKAAGDVDNPTVKAASDKIQAYFDNHCQS